MASGERRAARTVPADEDAAMEAMSDALIDRVVGPAWERLGPLSAGAVAGSVAIVGARGFLRRVFGRRYGRIINERAKDQEPQAGDDGADLPDGGLEKADG
jgi:hypothetical protein